MAKKRLPQWFRAAFRGLQLESTPDVCFGAPRIASHRLKAEPVAGRFAAGDSIEQIAKSYNVHPSSIEDCIRFVLRVSDVRELDLGDFKPEKISGV